MKIKSNRRFGGFNIFNDELSCTVRFFQKQTKYLFELSFFSCSLLSVIGVSLASLIPNYNFS